MSNRLEIWPHCKLNVSLLVKHEKRTLNSYWSYTNFTGYVNQTCLLKSRNNLLITKLLIKTESDQR